MAGKLGKVVLIGPATGKPIADLAAFNQADSSPVTAEPRLDAIASSAGVANRVTGFR